MGFENITDSFYTLLGLMFCVVAGVKFYQYFRQENAWSTTVSLLYTIMLSLNMFSSWIQNGTILGSTLAVLLITSVVGSVGVLILYSRKKKKGKSRK